MITWITEKELEDNGFYYRIVKRNGKVTMITVENKEKMVSRCLENIRRLKEL